MEEEIEEILMDQPQINKPTSPSGLSLELGDIIEIIAPTNKDIHEMTAFISYIDNKKIILINVSNSKHYQLNLTEVGGFTDESITEVNLLNRSDEKGYARQNNLLPKTWITIHFGGDIPTTITGEITNLEEDMIEITSYPDLDVLYIDFAYKGIPENIPIERIDIGKKPAFLKNIDSLSQVAELDENAELLNSGDLASMEFTETGESIIHIPETAEIDENVRSVLHDVYVDANTIVFGERLEAIKQLVEVPENEQRYGVETQVNDLMDELLSTIPNSQRTKLVLDNIHLLIERFKQLREEYSKFDENQNIYDFKTYGAYHKPLIEKIQKIDTRLQWLVPVVSNRKKIYDDEIEIDANDVITEKSSTELRKIEKLQNDYYKPKTRNNPIDYSYLNNAIQSIMTPFEQPINTSSLLTTKQVLMNIDSIIDNLDDFQSTVYNSSGIAKRKFVIQRYNLGLTRLEQQVLKTGKKIYRSAPMTPNDSMTIKSFMMLPANVMQYSKIDLPGTPLIEKASLHHYPFMLFLLLRKNTDIITNIIKDLTNELKYDADDDKENKNSIKFLTGLQEYILSDDLDNIDNKFQKFLEIVIPRTRTLIRLVRKYIKDKLSFVDVVQYLEPFMVYSSDITYKQYMEIRYFIKEQIAESKKNYAKKSNDFNAIRNARYNVSENMNSILRILSEKKEFTDGFMNAYKLAMKDKNLSITPTEALAKMLELDNANLYTHLMSSLLISLMTPSALIDVLSPPDVPEMSELEKIKPTDCSRRYLAKKYESLSALQKDNNVDELYFDKEFDDTPYAIIKKYKDEQKKMTPEEFLEYFTEILIQKHDCPPESALELATTIISNKRLVKEEHYAMLELTPKLPADVDENKLTEKEKEEVQREANLRKKIQYYRRLKNNWVHDDSIDDNSFLDTNTLFCNISKNCFKNTKNNVCETLDTTEARLEEIQRKNIINEFDKRYNVNVEELEKTLEKDIEYYQKFLVKLRTFNEIKSHKSNNLSYELGKFASVNDGIQSPYLYLRNMILGQDDFTKKQFDIVRFVDKFCREPMVNELEENAHWKYCKDTNIPLMPTFLFQLANVFINGGDFALKEAEICNEIGVLSDDGDSIVDKHSGFVIRKLEFSTEEGFDEAGFRITTHAVMEKEAGTQLLEVINKTKNQDKIFENSTSEMIYNVFKAISNNIDIPIEGLESFVLRTTNELMEKTIKSKENYDKESQKIEKEKGKRRKKYELYRDELTIIIIASVLFIGIQTSVPSFQSKKTFPGCIRSFGGFPLTGLEDITGIQYISCVLNKTKSKISVWSAIEKSNADTLAKQMKEYIDKVIMKRGDINELYVKKREYLLTNPDIIVSQEHNISKWLHFLPPVIEFDVAHSTRNVSTEFKKEFLELIRKGSKDQDESYQVLKGKVTLFGYSIIEYINHIIKSKDLLLKTTTRIPFIENACCNENNNMTNPLSYFIHENDNIKVLLHNSNQLIDMISDYKTISKASILYHPTFTGMIYPSIPVGHLEETIYACFIRYCNFDRNLPVPEEFKTICSEKPINYNKFWTIQEKTAFLKKNGKQYTVDDLYTLMKLVNQRNIVETYESNHFTKVDAMNDIIDSLDVTNCIIVDNKLREHLRKVLDKFNPKVMTDIDSYELENLKEYLYTTNDLLYHSILDFIDRYGNLSQTQYTNISNFLANLTKWNSEDKSHNGNLYYDEEIYTITQYIQNAVYSMSKEYPNIILNEAEHYNIPRHWGFVDIDESKLQTIIQNYYKNIEEFKGDTVISRLLMEVSNRLIDLNLFTQNIPIITPIQKNSITFHSLFDKRTIYALLLYCFYSVLCEYICAADEPDLLRIDVENFKLVRREKIYENSLESNQISAQINTLDENFYDNFDDLNEQQILLGNQDELKQRVCKLLLGFIDIEEANKKAVNFSYSDIKYYVTRSKNKEKMRIVKNLGELSIEERRVEDMMKNYKLGKWNVGMQKGLVQYDAITNERETNDLMQQLLKDVEQGDIDIVTEMTLGIYDVGQYMNTDQMADVEEVQQFENQETDNFYDREAFGIEDLGEDYADGQYYEEDIDRDDY